VRPRFGVGSLVSGLDTLLSGVYIGMKTGAATLREREFCRVGESGRSIFARSARFREFNCMLHAPVPLALVRRLVLSEFQVGRVID